MQNKRRNGKYCRAGRSRAALAVGLFLLGMLLVFPICSRWFGADRSAASRVLDSYRFDEQWLASQADVKPSTPQLEIKQWHFVDDLQVELAQFETVFWEPEDTDSLRQWISDAEEVEGSSILEIGTGTGLVSIACLLQGAERVVATDINPHAYANARYNAEHLELSPRLETRLVSAESPGPFSVVPADERFDLILSNPPWEDAEVNEVAAFALYDPAFALLDGLLEHAADHLNLGGKLLLAYGAKQAIERIQSKAPQLGWTVTIDDERKLSELPEVFVPGMLLILSRERTLH